MSLLSEQPIEILEESSSEITTLYERCFHFLHKHFSRKEKTGLFLTLSVLLIVLAFFFFSIILQDYLGHDPLVRADTRIENLIYTIRSDTFNNIMLFLTLLGTWQIVFSGLILIGFILFSLNLLPHLCALLVSVIGGEVMVAVVKNLVQRPRPPALNALLLENSFSFPSGHTVVAISFYGLTAYIIYRLSKTKTAKILAIIGGVTMVSLVAFSRVYLGVHWPSDIMASLALGTAWVTLLITILEVSHTQSWDKQTPRLIGKRFILIPSFILGALWLSYVSYFFSIHPLNPATNPAQAPLFIYETDIPNHLFTALPKTSETVTGSPIEPIDLVIVGNYGELIHAFDSAGWVQPEPITIRTTWHSMVASIFNKPYPQNIEASAFWNSRPNDFSFQLPTATIRQRHHIHFWATPFRTDHDHRIWFATAHFDKAINLKTIIPTHSIDPYIDHERETIKDQLINTGSIDLIEQFQVTKPQQGKNPSGDKFITDGKAYVLFLKDS